MQWHVREHIQTQIHLSVQWHAHVHTPTQYAHNKCRKKTI